MTFLPESLEKLVAELTRRHVIRVGVVYVVVAWAALQAASIIFPALRLPEWTLTLVVVLVLLGLPLALLLAWAFEITPDGVRRTEGPSPAANRGRLPWSVAVVALAGVAGASSFLARSEPAPPDRVVVVPFENRTGDAGLEPVGQMTADGITQHLARTGLVELVAGPRPVLAPAGDSASGGPGDRASGGPNGGRRVPETDAAIAVTGAYYVEGNRLLFQAQVTDVATGRILSAIDPASSGVDGPRSAIDLLGQRVAGVMAVLFDPRLDDGPRRATSPSPRFAAYTELRKALGRLFASDFDAAMDRFAKAARVDTAFLQPTLVRGATAAFLQRFGEAAAVRDTLLEAADRLSPLELVQADALDGLLAGDWAGFGEAWEGGPDLAPSFNAFLRGWAALRAGRPEEAVAVLGDLHPDRGGLVAELAPYWDLLTTALHAAGDHTRELREARTAARHLPPSPLTLFLETRALAAQGRSDAVLERINAIPNGGTGGTPWRQVTPLPDVGAALMATADELRAHGHPDAASEVLRAAEEWYARQGPADSSSAHRLARARLDQAAGRPGRARERLAGVTGEADTAVAVLELRGTVAAQLGDTATARRVLAALDDPERPDAMGSRTFARARIAYLLGREEEALELVRTARSLGYDVATALHLDPGLAALLETAMNGAAAGAGRKPGSRVLSYRSRSTTAHASSGTMISWWPVIW